MRLQPVCERLSGWKFVTIGGALEFAALTKLPGRLPAAYVVPQADTATKNNRASVVIDQKVSELFAVVIILPAVAAKPGVVSELLEEAKKFVTDQVVGWTHPDGNAPCEYAGGEALSVDGTALTWALRFTTSHHIRKAP